MPSLTYLSPIGILFALLAYMLPSWSHAQDPKPVVVAQVTEDEVRLGQRVVGTVNPLRNSTIGSAIDGRVQDFFVNEGEAVQQGQPLAQLRTETLRIEKAAAEAELELARNRLLELKNGSRPEEIQEADANRRAAEAAVLNADRKLFRMEALAERSAASEIELDDAREQAKSARFTLEATEALLKRIKEGPRAELIAQAEAQLDLQQQRLNLIEDRIQKSTIKAPFDGFVSAEFTEIGAWISRGDPIAQVIQMDEVEVLAPVTADAIVNLRIGDELRVEFPELPNELVTGKIERIVPVASSRARTFPVFIRLSNQMEQGTPMLKAGMLARVDIPAGKRELMPLVPKDALVLNGNERSVFVVEKQPGSDEGIARKVNVQLGIAIDNRIQVVGDITAEDWVVVQGNERLSTDTKVKVLASPN